MSFLYYLFFTLMIVISVFMVLLILIQKGRGGGLSSAFGGSGGNTAFGNKTGDVLTWTTAVVFGIFIVIAVVLNLVVNNINPKSTVATGPEIPPMKSTAAETTPPAEPTSTTMPTTLPAK